MEQKGRSTGGDGRWTAAASVVRGRGRKAEMLFKDSEGDKDETRGRINAFRSQGRREMVKTVSSGNT